MDKITLHWIFKPAWQLCLWQFAMVSAVVLVIYMLALRTEWQATITGKNKIITMKSIVVQLRQQLSSLPKLAVIKENINHLLPEENQWQKREHALVQRINRPLFISGGQLLGWEDKENLLTEKNVIRRHGRLTIRVSYSGLVNFLQEVVSLQPPVHITQMNIDTEKQALVVGFELAEYIMEADDEPPQ